MKKIAVFPGSFSPFTYGHYSIIERMIPLFDTIIVAIGKNSLKDNSYPAEKNKEWIEKKDFFFFLGLIYLYEFFQVRQYITT